AEKYLLKIVEEGYEKIALDFSETRKKPTKEAIYQIVTDLKISPDDKILDLGCGNGCFFEVLAGRGRYLGIDNSQRLIELAQKKYQANFKKLDITKLEFLESNGFNFVFSWAVFHHLPGRKIRSIFLQEVYNKLEPNGTFIISVWKLRNKNNFFKVAFKSFFKNLFLGRILDWADLIFPWKGSFLEKQPLRYYHAFSRKSLEKEIVHSNFKIEKLLEDDFNYYLILKKV
ncbi:MAG: class I SAM-dependent methyltransferase, partial [Patescibacteria group bacterium]|nr:class I SAM-dependent methyltransferase [Patescibacteria group bacterium]